MDNGFLLEPPTVNYRMETIRILASHGSLVKVRRDGTLPEVQNKYTIEPPNLNMDASAVRLDGW